MMDAEGGSYLESQSFISDLFCSLQGDEHNRSYIHRVFYGISPLHLHPHTDKRVSMSCCPGGVRANKLDCADHDSVGFEGRLLRKRPILLLGLGNQPSHGLRERLTVHRPTIHHRIRYSQNLHRHRRDPGRQFRRTLGGRL